MAKRKKKSVKKRRLKRWKQLGFLGKVWRFLWVTFLIVWGFSLFQVLYCTIFNPPITPLMVQRFFQQVKDPDRVVRFERDYVSIDDISPNLVNAVVVSEDGLFMYHHGFDIKQMKMAYIEGKTGRRHRGGSTISQQTAKNCFLPHTHSMVRKAVEAYYTTLIEMVWSKKRIMERYLNVIEFGDGIYGCEAASQHYFGHSAKELSKREAALLAVCLPTPLRSNPGHPSGYLNRQSSVVQGRMARYGRINLEAKREDLNQRYVRQMDEENLWDFVVWMLTDGESLTSKHGNHHEKSYAPASSHHHASSNKSEEAEQEEPEEVIESGAPIDPLPVEESVEPAAEPSSEE